MKTQKFGKPQVSLSWLIKEDNYAKERNRTTVESEKGKIQLADTILTLIDQGMEIRIGTDGYCLMLEANTVDDEYIDASYQFVDEDCELFISRQMPDETYRYFISEEAYQEELEKFLKKHPYYKKDEYGRWYDDRTEEGEQSNDK